MSTGEPWIEPSPVTILSGDERFAGTDATVRDFWVWSTSDLRDNTTRGVLAEFLVARAVGAEASMRVGWDNYGVESPERIRIEVKASAYLQSWAQRRLSTIRFSGLTGLSWDDKEGWGQEREVRADVFVFAIQTCTEPDRYDALDVGQWVFHVVPASVVREHGARSVGMGFLNRYAPEPVAFAELAAAIRDSHVA